MRKDTIGLHWVLWKLIKYLYHSFFFMISLEESRTTSSSCLFPFLAEQWSIISDFWKQGSLILIKQSICGLICFNGGRILVLTQSWRLIYLKLDKFAHILNFNILKWDCQFVTLPLRILNFCTSTLLMFSSGFWVWRVEWSIKVLSPRKSWCG